MSNQETTRTIKKITKSVKPDGTVKEYEYEYEVPVKTTGRPKCENKAELKELKPTEAEAALLVKYLKKLRK